MSKGIDIHIDHLISRMTAKLFSSNTRQFNGRIFRNEIKNGYAVKIQPLVYDVNGIASEVLRNDAFDFQCFFDVLPESTIDGNLIKSNVRIMLMCDLKKIYPLLNFLDSSQTFQNETFKIISSTKFNVEKFISGWTGYSDYEWSEDALAGMNPNHLFRYDCTIFYTNNC